MELRRQSGAHHLVGSMAGIGQAFQENHRRQWAPKSRRRQAGLEQPNAIEVPTTGLRREIPGGRWLLTTKSGCSRVAAYGTQKNYHCRSAIKLSFNWLRSIHIVDAGSGKVADSSAAPIWGMVSRRHNRQNRGEISLPHK